MGKISGGDSWWGLVLAVVVSGALGALVALPSLRLRGLYLALATLAFGEAAYFAFFNNNVVIPQGSFIPVGRLRLPFMHAVGDRADMIEVLVATALCAVLVGVIRRSAFGRRLVALSDSPAAFATVGLNASRTKVYVFALSAAMAGFGGVLYAGQPEAIGSNDVQFFGSLTLLLFVAIWGMRSLTGALLGGMTAAALPSSSRTSRDTCRTSPALWPARGSLCWGRAPTAFSASIGWWPTSACRSPTNAMSQPSSSPIRTWPMPVDTAALEVRAVGVRFGGVTALSGVSLTASAGEVTGLIGPNGAGKTTLFNVITGLQRPDHGDIFMHGQDVARKGPTAGPGWVWPARSSVSNSSAR